MQMQIVGLDFKAQISELSTPQVELPFPIQLLNSNKNVQYPEDSIVMLNDSPDNIASYMSKTGVWNIVQSDSLFFNEKISVSAHLMQNPQGFLEEPSKEILTPYWRNDAPNKSIFERRWSFRTTSEKQFILKMIKQYVQDIPGARGIMATVLAIADEIFTNALYNAPFGDLDSTLDRSTLVVLDSEMAAQIIVGYTNDQLFLGCTDAFGTLNCDSLLDRICQGFRIGISESINMDRGGAGVGIIRVVELSPHIYIVVERNKKTLVGCSFPLNKSSKKNREAPKSFYFQSYQNIETKSGAIRVGRRGYRGCLRISGDILADFPFNEIDLTGIEEVKIDMKVLTSPPRSFILDMLKNFSLLKKISFEYVSRNSVSELKSIIMQSKVSAEILSVVVPYYCSPCKQIKNILFVKCAANPLDVDKLKCEKCSQQLDSNAEKQFIQL